MGKPERFTVEQIIEAIETGHTAQAAGKLLGCTGEAIRYYARKYVTVDKALRAERKNLRDAAQNSMLAAVYRGEGWAVGLTFKTIDEDGGFIDANRVNVEHSGTVTLKGYGKITPDDWDDADDKLHGDL